MSAQPIIVRASSLSGYPDCPRRSAAKVFRRDVLAAGYELRTLDSSIGAVIGSGVHAAAKVILDEKAKTGALPPDDVATDAGIQCMRDRAAEEGCTYDRETPSLNDGEKQVVRMARAYRYGIAPQVEPLIVEERFEAQVTPTLVMSGQADVIAREPGRVRDLKTGKARSNHKPQLGAYALLAKANGIDVNAACEDFVRRVALKNPQPEAATFSHDLAGAESAAIAIIRHMESDLSAFREGDFARDLMAGDPWAFPANPNSKLCSAKWCPAWGTAFCTEHQTTEEN